MSWFSSLKSAFSPAKEISEDDIQQVLQNYRLPNKESLKTRITAVQLQDYTLQLTMNTFPSEADHLQRIHDELSLALEKCGIQTLNLHIVQQKEKQQATTIPPTIDAASNATQTPKQAVPKQQEIPAHPRIKDVILVSSGKGGVGKSTTTVNLALALQKLGKKVGVLDADIYGPSIPTMLGNAGKTPLIEDEKFIPLEAHGMAVLSIGHLTGDNNTPVAWRGPKATGALMQLFNQTLWPELDVLVVDMPPGTGDIQLTLAQRIPVTGAVIVTTPQNIALLDAIKGIELFNRVSIPVLGVIENMSTHICSNCGHEDEIFGVGGGEQLVKQYQIPLLGRLPLTKTIRENTDNGMPSVFIGDAAANHYMAIAEQTLLNLEKVPQRMRDNNRIF
ncbi:iron-sulfur cluster carrier protein ApbC [Acinetobacter nectaris]|uniref:iron-sulfur cluster carrier protein ApbC n=1 Tax=Acinetobacter nectaris TaxID=1219382 RepID=UPI001F00F0E7|nr:iron-sulfur cluster carrier protein ApbC [Acinetobacter nectaris]MCF8999790.1 iron-sulfur cluster carrier protein ApbC [Acinetobacter nectaris]MCF9026696.1 iron-sulfur cluster carrier protein ApbC [Acinetobacter nectaris]